MRPDAPGAVPCADVLQAPDRLVGMERLRREVSTGVKHGAVGLVATGLSLVVFNLLVHGFGGSWAPFNDNPSLAVILANTAGMAVSFPATRRWVFPAGSGRSAWPQLAWFLVLNFATMLIPVLCIVFTRAIGLNDPVSDNLAANVIGATLANIARYVAYRQWLFSALTEPPRIERVHVTDTAA